MKVQEHKENDSTIDSTITIPSDWYNVSGTNSDIRLCQIAYQGSIEDCPPLVVTRSLIVHSDMTWKIHTWLCAAENPSLADIPETIDTDTIMLLLDKLGHLTTCPGNPDKQFVSLAKMRKNGQFLSNKKDEVRAYLDTNACVTNGDHTSYGTVRSSKCLLLTNEKRCKEFLSYRKTLLALSL